MTREAARALRRGIPAAARAAWSRRIAEHVLHFPPYRRAGTVMAYASVGHEVDTWGLLAAIWAEGKRLALPRCRGAGVMEAYEVFGPEELAPGAFSIPEPGGGAPLVAREEIDLILVPGLLFDRRGNRLGQGGGYYDRYLAGYAGIRLGLGFGPQVADSLRAEPHDQRMDALVTEAGLFMTKEGDL